MPTHTKTEGYEPSFSLTRADSRHTLKGDSYGYPASTAASKPRTVQEAREGSRHRRQINKSKAPCESGPRIGFRRSPKLHGHHASRPFIQGKLRSRNRAIEARVREKADGSDAKGARFTLADAQFLIAGAHGFENWAEFAESSRANHERISSGSERPGIRGSVDAVVTGDIATLESLLRQQPDLVRARSARIHRATLLHYVAANGVEDFRQKTPPNAVAVARVLLEAGAEVDAIANTYGGGKAQTTMNLLVSSTHPAEPGFRERSSRLCSTSAQPSTGWKTTRHPLMTALAFGYGEAARSVGETRSQNRQYHRRSRSRPEDLVRSFVVDRETLKPGVRLVAPPWLGLRNDPAAHIELAFVWACKFGRTPVVEFLLGQGLDPGPGIMK